MAQRGTTAGTSGFQQLVPASLWRRALAAVIDGVALVLLGWPVAAVVGTAGDSGYQLSGGPAMLLILLWFAYYAGTEAAWGATAGKRLLRLRVVAQDGSVMGLSASVVRNGLRVLDFPVLYLAGFLVALTSPRRQRIGDYVAGTVVVLARPSPRRRSHETTVV